MALPDETQPFINLQVVHQPAIRDLLGPVVTGESAAATEIYGCALSLRLRNSPDPFLWHNPFFFKPGVGLIAGFTHGVLQMRVGERAHIYVPAALAWGPTKVELDHLEISGVTVPVKVVIPVNSDLVIDIEIFEMIPANSALFENMAAYLSDISVVPVAAGDPEE